MKILVTGGAGFIGSHIVDAYIRNGHEVVVVDDLSSGSKKNINTQAQFYKLDIQSPALRDLFSEHNFEVVNHHAAQMDVRKSVAEPKHDASINVLGTLNILQSCVDNKVNKVIFASTGGAVYGEQEVFPADEKHPTWPVSPYGITKLACEKYLFYYYQMFGLSYITFRYANIYGPRQNPHGEAGVVAIFISKLGKGETPVINGDGRQTRDYLFVGDLVKANLMALDYHESNTFNIGTGQETDVNTIYRNLNELTGANAVENHGPAKIGEQLRSCLSFEKARSVLGWQPDVGLAEGLDKTVQYFTENDAEN